MQRWPAAQWLALALYWVLVTALVMSMVGLVLAVVGVFYPVLLLALGVPASVGLGVAGWRPFRRAVGELISGGILPIGVVVIVIIASAVSAAGYSSEQLLTSRDPGVYLTTGRWLADEGTLLVSGTVGGFADIQDVEAESPGYYEVRDDGTLDPQFLHLLPVWGAAAHWAGGDQSLLRVNALVMALAVAALWLFAATVTRPWFAVLAIAAASAILPTVHFARDLYSEPLMLLFVFSGLAFLTLARWTEHRGLSLLAGLMVGAVAMVRIDGWLVLIGVVAYLMAVWWSAEAEGTTTMISGFVHPALLGVLVSGSVGLFDGMVRSRQYLVGRGSQFALMIGLLVVVILVGLVALHWSGPTKRLVIRLGRHRNTIAWVIPVAIVIVAASLFFFRPVVQETHGALSNPFVQFAQRTEGLPVDGTRTYNEWSMQWLSWYLGFFGLALGVIGVAWAWRRTILGLRGLWPFLLTLSLTAAVYVLRPSITPDHLWAMRRFLPVVLPGLILAAVLATQWAFRRVTNQPLRWIALAVAIAILIVVPASLTWPLRTATSYVGMYDAIEEVCDAIPEGSAVLMADPYLSGAYQAPVRSFCGVPVSGVYVTDPSCAIVAANQAWADRGVNLIIGYGDELEVEPDVVVTTTYDIPELTLTRRPAELTTFVFSINLADADALDPSGCAA